MSIQSYELEDLIESRMSQYEAVNPMFAMFMKEGENERGMLEGCVNMVISDVGDMLNDEHIELFRGLPDNPNGIVRRGFFVFALTIYPAMRQWVIDNSPPSRTLLYFLHDVLPIMAKGLADGRAHTITLRAFTRLALHEYTALVELDPATHEYEKQEDLQHCYSTS